MGEVVASLHSNSRLSGTCVCVWGGGGLVSVYVGEVLASLHSNNRLSGTCVCMSEFVRERGEGVVCVCVCV